MTAPLPIGAAVLDVPARTLAGPVVAVRLPDQAAALLARLAARPGRVTTWGEAVDAMYGDGPCRVRDPVTVARARVLTVRRALRDVGAGAEVVTHRGEGLSLRVPAAPGQAGVPPREAA